MQEKLHMQVDKQAITQYINQLDFCSFVLQMENQNHIDWGADKDIYIVSDRWDGCGAGLLKFFDEKTNVKEPIYCSEYEDTSLLIKGFKPNMLIFVDVQEDETLYKLVEDMRHSNQKSVVVMYADKSVLAWSECAKYGISHFFDRNEPVIEFVEYLMKISQ